MKWAVVVAITLALHHAPKYTTAVVQGDTNPNSNTPTAPRDDCDCKAPLEEGGCTGWTLVMDCAADAWTYPCGLGEFARLPFCEPAFE